MIQILEQYLSVLTLFGFAIVFILLFIIVNKLLGPPPKKASNQYDGINRFVAYECGEVPIGEAQSRFNFQYYVFALVFVVFDVVSSLLVAWAFIIRPGDGNTTSTYLSKNVAQSVFFTAFSFIGVLIIGFLYWWRRNALRWM
ncbi:MAG: NADH-quinone oxidoreductase subunit A [Candidatus Heimdallarchaeota archaeon]|nr:NADH-quinone oxidoreductase subunit A [Candidatus Heimdallarchaeota archaeon]